MPAVWWWGSIRRCPAVYEASVSPTRLRFGCVWLLSSACWPASLRPESENGGATNDGGQTTGNADVGPAQPAVEIEYAAAGTPVRVRRTIRLDLGQFVEGEWVSGGPTEAEASVSGERVRDGGALHLHIGWNPVTVTEPGCTPVIVPVLAEPAVDFVTIPFLGCPRSLDAPAIPGGVRVDRREFSIARLNELRSLGLFATIPATTEPDDAPQRWLTAAEASDVCGFFGGRLMSQEEWLLGNGSPPARPVGGGAHGQEGPLGTETVGRTFSRGPAGHEDLVGNVAEWTSAAQTSDTGPIEGSMQTEGGAGDSVAVVGGSWLRPGTHWPVPANARSDEIGFRCAYSPEDGPQR